MSKRQWLMVVGAIIIILPYLGFPQSWKNVFFTLLGLIIIAISYSVLPKANRVKVPDSKSLPYSEHLAHDAKDKTIINTFENSQK